MQIDKFKDEQGKPISATFTAPIPQREPPTSSAIDQPPSDAAPALTHALFTDAIDDLVNAAFSYADQNHDGKLSLDEFRAWAAADATIISWIGCLGSIF